MMKQSRFFYFLDMAKRKSTQKAAQPEAGAAVIYKPFEDDKEIQSPTPGEIKEIHADGSATIELELDGKKISRQYIQQGEGFNTFQLAPEPSPEESPEAESSPEPGAE